MRIPHITMAHARVIAGGGAFTMTVMVFAMMWARPELAENDLFKSLSQAIVIQGLIGLVMAFLFTGNQTTDPAPPTARDAARQVADAADDERRQIEGEGV